MNKVMQFALKQDRLRFLIDRLMEEYSTSREALEQFATRLDRHVAVADLGTDLRLFSEWRAGQIPGNDRMLQEARELVLDLQHMLEA